MNKAFILIFTLLLFFSIAQATEKNPAVEAIQEYLEFAEYPDGSISIDQIKSVGSTNFTFIDTRNISRYEKSHIPDSINIEWRQILSRRNELPTNRPIVLYCDTGLLSSKAHLALKIAGMENVKVLQGGYPMWHKF